MKGIVRSPFYAGIQVPFLFMEKRFTVGYQILEISQLWSVHRGEIGFRNDALENREPDSAAGRIRSPNALFVALRPTRFETRPSKSCLPSPDSGHQYPPASCNGS